MPRAEAVEAAALEAEESGMQVALSPSQEEQRRFFRSFVDEGIASHAGEWDRRERVPGEVIEELRRRRYLGSILPESVGGGGMDPVTYGLLTEEIGRGCSSVRSLLTVHDMVGIALWRWASRALKEELLEPVARGELLGAFALSEPEVGSDAKSVTTEASRQGGDYVLTGRKKWITFGQIADLYLVFAQVEGRLTAFAVPADAPGLSRSPITGVVGTRAALLAELELDRCRVPARNVVGRVGFGFSHVAGTALDLGRFSVACGAVGVSQACLEASSSYTAVRHQFGAPIREHQLVQRKLTEMIVNTRAARLLCYRAGYLRRVGDPGATSETWIAKYFASRTAVCSALDAVQLHGAHGLTDEYPVARYLRDAKVTEIIEGSTQIQQSLIARFPPQEL